MSVQGSCCYRNRAQRESPLTDSLEEKILLKQSLIRIIVLTEIMEILYIYKPMTDKL